MKNTFGKKLRDFNKRVDKAKAENQKEIEARDASRALDCLNANDVAKIKKALRQVWSWSHSRRLVIKRCALGKSGYYHCEGCLKRKPKIHVDHISPIGTYDGGYIDRLFVPSAQLQGLCHDCHKTKTKADLKAIRDKKAESDDFF